MAEQENSGKQEFFDWERREDGSYAFYVRPPMLDFLSPEALEHMRAAQREVLLAMRSFIDAAISREEEAEADEGGARRIEVT